MSSISTRPIFCRCCNQRWGVDDIRALPGFPQELPWKGQALGLSLGKLGALLGHDFYYADGKARGEWSIAKPAAAPAIHADPPARSGWRYACETHDDLMPINGMRIPAAPDAVGEVGT